MKRNHTFTADDGTLFGTISECRRYEDEQHFTVILSELSPTQVRSAIDRTDVDLADALERAGKIIAAKRRESGDLKRARKKQDAVTSFRSVE